MTLLRTLILGLGVAAIAWAWAVPAFTADKSSSGNKVYELRIYTTNPGKMEDLHKRFRDHTNRLFKKHGMEIVGYWTPQDDKQGKSDKLIYLLAFPSREAAEASWKAFRDDPEWKRVYAESHKNGVLVKQGGVESIFLDPTDYSPLK
jgi:hypothetical protein